MNVAGLIFFGTYILMFESWHGLCTRHCVNELEVTASGETTTERDFSVWSFTPALEYSLMSSSFMLDASVDFNFSSDTDLMLGYMLWGQKRLWKTPDYNMNLTGILW